MTKEEWIAGRVLKMKELSFLQGLNENQIEWITEMFDSAWERGVSEGRASIHKKMLQWREEV